MSEMGELKKQINEIRSSIQGFIVHQTALLNTLNKSLESLSFIENKLDSKEPNALIKSLDLSLTDDKPDDKLDIKDKYRDLITTAEGWMKSWGRNRNTGSEAEIKVGLELLIASGLETRENIPNKIRGKKYSIPPVMSLNTPNIKVSKILGILNLTQKDDDGGTSDIAIIHQDGKRSNYSITQWKSSTLIKCMRNPSPMKMYNLHVHRQQLEVDNKIAYSDAVEYAEEKFGKMPSKKWKNKQYKSVASFMGKLAKTASDEWGKFSKKVQMNKLSKILDLDSSMKTRSDGIIFFNKKTDKIERVYKWNLRIDLNQALKCRSDGISIIHYLDDRPDEALIKTQAKYNNGVIEGLNVRSKWKIKPGRPFSSWNCSADLKKIFNMTRVRRL